MGSLRQFGLLDGNKGALKVSDLAVEILFHPKDSPEYRSAIRQAALEPSLFSEAYKTYKESSDDSLKAHLITQKGFTEDGADQFVRSFRATLALVSEDGTDYDDPQDDDGQDDLMGSPHMEQPAPTPAPPASKGSGGLWLKVPFRGSEMSIRIESGGQKLTKGHLERVRKYLELAEDDLEPDTTGD